MPSCYHGQSSSACTSGSSGIGSGWALSTIPGSTVQVHGGWAPSTGPIPVTDPGLSGSSHPVNPTVCVKKKLPFRRNYAPLTRSVVTVVIPLIDRWTLTLAFETASFL